MLTAIVASLVTLVVICIVVFFVLRNVSKHKTNDISVKRDVSAISSVGVKSTLPEENRRPAGGVAHGATPTQPVAKVSDALKGRFVAVLSLAGIIFGTLSAKLWSMQVLTSSTYTKESEENQYTTVYTTAPRGNILDTNGTALVKNRSTISVLADPDVANDHEVMARLSVVLGLPLGVVRARLESTSAGAQSQRTVCDDTTMRNASFIAEHSSAFSGITIQTNTIRDYPYASLAAHVLGYIGSVTSDDVANVADGRSLKLGDVVGRSGIEQAYDNLLAGDHGQRKVVADAEGNIVEVASETAAVKGSDVYTTLNGAVQYTADKALYDLITPNGGNIGSGKGIGGAVVVMNIEDGSIIAMSSFPTFSPKAFIGGLDDDTNNLYFDAEQSKAAQYPMLNRAIQGTYPAASTYKTFTGLAALEHSIANSTDEKWQCSGSWDGFGTGQPQKCWLNTGHGELDFKGAIVNSCDSVFYDIGYSYWDAAYNQNKSETLLQDFLKKYHLDQSTGIDISGESQGRIPTPSWKAEWFRDTPEDSAWQGGDYTNMCIGQGYVLVTPIELCVAYGAIATGNIVKPHLLKEVHNAAGDVVLRYKSEVVDTPDVSMAHLAAVRSALQGVATDNSDISKLFTEQGIDPATIACKTGTAEYTDSEDTAWFACYAPYDNPKYALACVIEHGGGGSSVAAPIGAQVMASVLSAEAGEEGYVGAIAAASGKADEDAGKASSSGRSD